MRTEPTEEKSDVVIQNTVTRMRFLYVALLSIFGRHQVRELANMVDAPKGS